MIPLLLALLATTAPTTETPTETPPTTETPAAETKAAQEWTQPRWDFLVVPIVGLNVDEGVAGGLLFALHRYAKDGGAFLDDVALRFYLSARLVQRHELKWEGTRVFDLPLRIAARIGFDSTVTQNYCGTGNGVVCDPARAEAAARAEGFVDVRDSTTDRFDVFVRHYYLTRFLRPRGDVLVRWALAQQPVKVEVMAGMRLAYYIPGDFTERTPWPGSLYATAFPDGEAGLSSMLQVGLTFDHRDFEPSPTRGFFIETSLRASSPLWGSRFTSGGVNASVAFYVPLPLSLVLATRTLGDLMVGEVPTDELGSIGGTRDTTAFGGQWLGRGLREHRGLGKIKVIEQFEVRRDFFDFAFWGVRVDVGAGVFADAGFIGFDLNDFGGGVPAAAGGAREAGAIDRILFGGGVGLRLLINRSLLLRLDVAASPFEQNFPSFYTPFNYPF